MKSLNPSDTFQVSVDSPMRFDVGVLYDLYAPIVGIKALSLYLFLRRLGDKERNFEELSMLSQLSLGEIDGSLSPLEAMGLLSTSKTRGEGVDRYYFIVRLPAEPDSFFTSPLYSGTLRKYAPNGYFEAMKERYLVDREPPAGYVDVGESYISYFRPENTPEPYLEDLGSDKKRRLAIKTGFDWNLFVETLSKMDPRYGTFRWGARIKKDIVGYATLYGYREEAIASFFDSNCDLNREGKDRVDWKSFVGALESNIKTKGTKKVTPKKSVSTPRGELTEEFFERARNLSPRDFLSYLQGGNRVAGSDLNLLKKITIEMGLPGEVANGLVQFVLMNYDNTLPSALVEKLAGSLVRANVETVEDAMDYLTKTSRRKKKKVDDDGDGDKPILTKSEPEERKEGELSLDEEEEKKAFEEFMRSTFD